MEENVGSAKFLRATKQRLKSLDELEENVFHKGTRQVRREGWEIDPAKLTMKSTTAIGHGSFSSVFRATYDGKDVAVKVLQLGQEGQRTKAQMALLRKAFDQEVQLWSQLDHPNIIKFIGASGSEDIFSPRNICYMVAEYLQGGTLKSYLIRNSRTKLPLKNVIQLALDLARGLTYLHSKNIVHRDVKTENMLLDKSSKLKIADFGVARLESLERGEMTGQTGTLGYMAPEVLEGKPYDKKCDVYSFGICLWEIYCCGMPYTAHKFADLSSAIVNKELRPEIPKCCPRSLAKLMKSCWSSDPSKRPEMKDVVSVLESIDTSKGGGMIPHNQPLGCFCFIQRRGP